VGVELDAIHYSLAGVIVAICGTLVALTKWGFGYVADQNQQRLEDQRTAAKEKERVLAKVLPLVEHMSSIAEDMMTVMQQALTALEGGSGD
jgi:CHASE1-domain containing sensor protein